MKTHPIPIEDRPSHHWICGMRNAMKLEQDEEICDQITRIIYKILKRKKEEFENGRHS